MQRTFIPGSEWLFYKFYCGAKTADVIIEQIFIPVTESLINENIIDKWYFIRYNDPKPHLRLRFHVNNSAQLGSVIAIISENINPYIENNLINSVIIDTYNREVERYGSNTMELSETLFCNDSVLIANVISNLEGEEGEKYRWQFCIRSLDEFLNCFSFTTQQKQTLFEMLSHSFMSEFGDEKQMNRQISDKYRVDKLTVEAVLDRSKDEESEILQLFNLFPTYRTSISSIAEIILQLNAENKLEVSLSNLLASYIHMHCNRLFRSKQRAHEMVIYTYLSNYYKSSIARNKSMEK